VEQREFYGKQWNTLRWRIVFRLFFNRTLLNLFGRAPHSFIHTGTKDIASYYLKRVEYALTDIPISNNYFLQFILTGTYLNQADLPPYLKLESFDRLKSTVDKIRIVNGSVQEFLATQKINSFSKFNLSDIFETLSEHEKDSLFQEIIRVADYSSILVYWNNLVERNYPDSLNKYIFNDIETATNLYRKDRAFFYNKLIILNIKKQNV
jgi:S-adenosylmethionine-diacylglycerol 3-amino-3-carboxypropyl transferase